MQLLPKNESMSRKWQKRSKNQLATPGIEPGSERKIVFSIINEISCEYSSIEALKPQRYVLPLHHVTVLQFELILTAS
jgi:hypothetical protein